MKKILTFLVGCLLYVPVYTQQAILVSMDETITETICSRSNVELHDLLSSIQGMRRLVQAMREDAYALTDTCLDVSEFKVEIPKSDLPRFQLARGRGRIEIPLCDKLTLSEDHRVISSVITVTDTTILVVIFPNQFAGVNVYPRGSVDKLIKNKIAGTAPNILPLITFQDGSYYWRDEKLAALLIL